MCRNKVSKWCLEAPCCRKKGYFHAIRIPFCRLCEQGTVLTVNEVHFSEFLMYLSRTCSLKVLKLMYNCHLLLGSWTAGPALAVTVGPVRMTGHFNKASQGPCTPKFPKACDISLLPRTARSLIWRVWCGWWREVLLQNLPRFPYGFCSPSWALSCSSWTRCCLAWASWTFSSALDCIHMWRAPSDWGFCNITWHRTVSYCVLLAKKHCTVCVCDFDNNAPFLVSVFASLLDKYHCGYIFKTWVVRPALQGPSPAPFL